jgi:hypothetical protein
MNNDMQQRRAVERWRTRAVLAGAALLAAAAVIATVVAQTSGSSSSEQATAREPKAVSRAQISATGQSPLTVEGTGFRPRERVRLAVKGRKARVTARAGANGRFVAVFKDVFDCGSVTVSATGSKGSRASFNISQIVCIEKTP